jgi:hypothetical protein
MRPVRQVSPEHNYVTIESFQRFLLRNFELRRYLAYRDDNDGHS